MTNLAIWEKKEENIQARKRRVEKRGNVVYGCFQQEKEKAAKLAAQNKTAMLREAAKEGICFGIRLSGSWVSSIFLCGFILEWQNVRPEEIPLFVMFLLFAACSGGVFCLTGVLGNLWSRFFTFWK